MMAQVVETCQPTQTGLPDLQGLQQGMPTIQNDSEYLHLSKNQGQDFP